MRPRAAGEPRADDVVNIVPTHHISGELIRAPPRLGALTVRVYSCVLAGVMCLVIGSPTGTERPRVPSWTELGGLIYLAVVVTAAVCIAWFAATARPAPARSTA